MMESVSNNNFHEIYRVTPKVPMPFIPLYLPNVKNGFSQFGTYIMDSGRLSGKTQNIAEYCMTRITSIEGANIVICRAEMNDIRLTVFAMFENLISKYHLERLFEIRKSPFQITFLPYQNRIYFLAANGDINRTKGFQLPREEDYIDVVWYEEINEVDDPMYIDAANLTFLRFIRDCSKICYAYNPPEGMLHWANTYFPNLYKSGSAKRLYSTWEDIRGLLNKAIIDKILSDKSKDYDYYRYWYLGHIISLKGLVFKQFTREANTVKNLDKRAIVNMISRVIISGDGAIKNDATAFGALALLIDGRLLVLDSYYYDPVKENKQLADTDQARRICNWFIRFQAKYPGINLKQYIGTVDNANFNLLCVLQGTPEMGFFKWFPATDKSIVRDTHRLQNMFYEGLLIINDDPTTDNIHGINEIESYVYDEKNQEIKKNQADHYIDMLKYGTFVYANPNAFNIQRMKGVTRNG